jgi:hypothetical protein
VRAGGQLVLGLGGLAALLTVHRLGTAMADQAAGTAAAPAPPAIGEGLDPRKPLRLLPAMAAHQKQSMRDHLAAVQQIIAALGRDDFEDVAKAAGRIGYSEAMAQMCQHMSAATPGFSDLSLAFHRTADGIGEAARHRDRGGVLSALDRTLQTCVGCHATYRQEIVDERTWNDLTTAAH